MDAQKLVDFMKSDQFDEMSKHLMEKIVPRYLRGVVSDAPIRKCQKEKYLKKINGGLNVAQAARGFAVPFFRRKT